MRRRLVLKSVRAWTRVQAQARACAHAERSFGGVQGQVEDAGLGSRHLGAVITARSGRGLRGEQDTGVHAAFHLPHGAVQATLVSVSTSTVVGNDSECFNKYGSGQ